MQPNKTTSYKPKLYKLISTAKPAYDTYDSCVVVASCEDKARYIHPSGGTAKYAKWWLARKGGYNPELDAWCLPKDLIVQYIGLAEPELKVGTVICASFNAG